MNIEDCKEGTKVLWKFGGKSDYGIIVKHKGSIWADGNKKCVWTTWDISNHKHPQFVKPGNLILVEPPKQKERTYTKEEIIEYMKHVGYSHVEYNIKDIEEYFSADNGVRNAIQLLKERGYDVTKI